MYRFQHNHSILLEFLDLSSINLLPAAIRNRPITLVRQVVALEIEIFVDSHSLILYVELEICSKCLDIKLLNVVVQCEMIMCALV